MGRKTPCSMAKAVKEEENQVASLLWPNIFIYVYTFCHQADFDNFGRNLFLNVFLFTFLAA